MQQMADFSVQMWNKQAVTYDNPLFLQHASTTAWHEDLKTFPSGSISLTAMTSQFVAAASSWPSDCFTQVCSQGLGMSDFYLCNLCWLEVR